MRVGLAFGQSDARRAGRAMVSVGDVGMRHRGKRLGHRVGVRHAPQRVLHAVRRGEIEKRCGFRRGLHQGIDLRVRFEGEKDRFDMR